MRCVMRAHARLFAVCLARRRGRQRPFAISVAKAGDLDVVLCQFRRADTVRKHPPVLLAIPVGRPAGIFTGRLDPGIPHQGMVGIKVQMALGLIFLPGQRQFFFRIQGDRIVAVPVADRLTLSIAEDQRVAVLLRLTDQEQGSVRADGAAVAVRQVHQIILAVGHGHDVPHMRARTGAPVHTPGHAVAVDVTVEFRHVAEVLERLRVAFAHHVRAGILVEDVHQLPRVAVSLAAARRAAVVGDEIADLVTVSLQLLQVVQVFVLLHDTLGRHDRVLHALPRRSIYLVGIHAVVPGHRHPDVVIGRDYIYVFTVDSAQAHSRSRGGPGTLALVVPVQLIRAVSQQRELNQGIIDFQLLGDLFDARVDVLSIARPGDRDPQFFGGKARRQAQVRIADTQFAAVPVARRDRLYFRFQIQVEREAGLVQAPIHPDGTEHGPRRRFAQDFFKISQQQFVRVIRVRIRNDDFDFIPEFRNQFVLFGVRRCWIFCLSRPAFRSFSRFVRCSPFFGQGLVVRVILRLLLLRGDRLRLSILSFSLFIAGLRQRFRLLGFFLDFHSLRIPYVRRFRDRFRFRIRDDHIARFVRLLRRFRLVRQFRLLRYDRHFHHFDRFFRHVFRDYILRRFCRQRFVIQWSFIDRRLFLCLSHGFFNRFFFNNRVFRRHFRLGFRYRF